MVDRLRVFRGKDCQFVGAGVLKLGATSRSTLRECEAFLVNVTFFLVVGDVQADRLALCVWAASDELVD